MTVPEFRHAGCLLTALTVLAFVSGCATTTTPESHAPAKAQTNIEVQDAVGFTIVEDGRIGGAVRSDYDTALAYLRQGQLEQGIELLETLVASAPHLTAPRIDLGIAYRETKNLEAARTHLELALETSPSHPIAHNELGIVYRKLGLFREARQSYEAALSIFPSYHYARRNLAVLCDLYLADLACALENYQAYMATVPGDEEASMWIADIQYRMGGPRE